ncbi:hypothetical protein SANTM175S_07226 [Streptomyces antimycoticus]
MSRCPAAVETSSNESTGAAEVSTSRGRISVAEWARPTMSPTTSSWVWSASGEDSSADLPSRSTVTVSQTANTSSSLWLTKTTHVPRAFSRRTTSNRRSASCGERDAVGSSRSSTRLSVYRAFAISTNCCRATDSSGPAGPGERPPPRHLSAGAVAARSSGHGAREGSAA